MHRVQYAGGSLLTGDAVAAALLDYAAALARNATSATVEIPVREADGARGVAQVLIGPASQLVSTHEPDTSEEITDDALVERFAASTRHLDSFGALPLGTGQSTVPAIDYDLPDLGES